MILFILNGKRNSCRLTRYYNQTPFESKFFLWSAQNVTSNTGKNKYLARLLSTTNSRNKGAWKIYKVYTYKYTHTSKHLKTPATRTTWFVNALGKVLPFSFLQGCDVTYRTTSSPRCFLANFTKWWRYSLSSPYEPNSFSICPTFTGQSMHHTRWNIRV